MRSFIFCVVVPLLFVVGCGSNAGPQRAAPRANAAIKLGSESKESPAPAESPPGGSGLGGKRSPEEAPQPPGKVGGGEAKADPVRKVIYNATMTVTVKNLDEAGDALNELVVKFGGYVVKSNVTGSVGSQRHGTWTARIPVKDYNTFRLAVKNLGITESAASDSQDVTEEFYDTKSRIATLKEEEKSLVVLLESLAKNYSESKSVRQDLWQVREKIEQLEGRLNYLDKLTAMTTFTIILQEQQKRYVAPDPPLTPPPTFPETIQTTFETSFDLLTTVGKYITLVLVALAPWLPVLLLLSLVLFLWYRRNHPVRPAPAPANPNPPA